MVIFGIAPAAKHWTQSGVLDGATVQGLAVGAKIRPGMNKEEI
jgi:hypothetical protein